MMMMLPGAKGASGIVASALASAGSIGRLRLTMLKPTVAQTIK